MFRVLTTRPPGRLLVNEKTKDQFADSEIVKWMRGDFGFFLTRFLTRNEILFLLKN